MKVFNENGHEFIFRQKVGPVRQYKCKRCCVHTWVHGDPTTSLHDKFRDRYCVMGEHTEVDLGYGPDGKKYACSKETLEVVKKSISIPKTFIHDTSR